MRHSSIFLSKFCAMFGYVTGRTCAICLRKWIAQNAKKRQKMWGNALKKKKYAKNDAKMC